MRTPHCGTLALGLLVTSALLVEGSALARGQARTAQLEAPADGDTKVAQRKGKRKSKDAAAARVRAAGKGKRPVAKASPAQRPPAPSTTTSDDESEQDRSPIGSTRTGPARVDFDERLVQGQASKSGAIYIFERKGAELRTMVRRRQSFREEILRTVE